MGLAQQNTDIELMHNWAMKNLVEQIPKNLKEVLQSVKCIL